MSTFRVSFMLVRSCGDERHPIESFDILARNEPEARRTAGAMLEALRRGAELVAGEDRPGVVHFDLYRLANAN